MSILDLQKNLESPGNSETISRISEKKLYQLSVDVFLLYVRRTVPVQDFPADQVGGLILPETDVGSTAVSLQFIGYLWENRKFQWETMAPRGDSVYERGGDTRRLA